MAVGIIGLWLTTLIHHVYGAYVYDTFWRVIAPIMVFPVILLLTFLLFDNLIQTRKYYKKIVFIFVVLLLWIIPIGFIEGGYAHVLKNVLFFGNASSEMLHQLFPPEFGKTRFFENTNDYFFEISGISQFFVGVYALYFLIKFSKELQSENKN